MPLVIGPLICERNQWCLVEMHIGIWEVLCFGSYKLTTSGHISNADNQHSSQREFGKGQSSDGKEINAEAFSTVMVCLEFSLLCTKTG